MKLGIILMLGVLLLAITMTGCSKDTTDGLNATGDRIDDVDLVVTSIQFNGVLYPMKNDKVTSPEGINIDLKETDYNQGELYTLASKKPTIGVLSNINVGKAYLQGEEFKVLTPYYREILGPDNKTMGQVVILKNNDITNPKQLEGKTVGIQGLADGSTIAFMTVLRQVYQVDLDKVNFEVVDSNMAPILLEEGKLDASMFDSDYILTEDFDTKYKTLVDFNKQMYYWYGTVPPASFFVVKKEFYDSDPRTFNKIIDYFTEAYSWYKDNAEEVSRMESEQSGTSYELTLLKSQYEERAGHVTGRDIAAYHDFYETAVMRGVIDEVPDLNKIFIR